MDISMGRKRLREAGIGLLFLSAYGIWHIVKSIISGELNFAAIEEGVNQAGAAIPANLTSGLAIALIVLGSIGLVFNFIIGLTTCINYRNIQRFGLLRTLAVISLILGIIGGISQIVDLFGGKATFESIMDACITVCRVILLFIFMSTTKKILREEDAE